MQLELSLDRQSSNPLSQQLYEQLRDLILLGTLAPGQRIPTTRELSHNLKLSRPTITVSLNQLAKEGYIDIKHGSGVFVCLELRSVAATQAHSKDGKPDRALPLTEFGRFAQERELLDIDGFHGRAEAAEIAFHFWTPALDQFPITDWGRCLGRQRRLADRRLLDLPREPEVSRSLREAISGLVERFRGVSCKPEQVVLVAGLDQAVDLACRLHVDRGAPVAIENPGYPGARRTIEASGGKLLPISVDAEGLQVEQLRKETNPAPRLVYVTPSRQFPTGATMSLARRLELLDWARETGALILEDDYDSEYESAGRPVPALMSLDGAGSVIYAGTMQQVMFPSVGVGYLILPPNLVPLYRNARQIAGVQLPAILQAAMAEFILEGHVDRHIRHLRALYTQRRTCLVTALRKTFAERVKVSADNAGVFILARFDSDLTSSEICSGAAALGVALLSTNSFYMGVRPKNEIIFGFGNLSETDIVEGVRRVGLVIGRK
jgi:GntR family transcriptional regulator/MocR family aminotransferase